MTFQGVVLKTNKDFAEHYLWGAGCDGWKHVDRPELSVILERMPPGTSEKLHFHNRARQFFYVVAGMLTLEIEGETIPLNTGEGVEVAPGSKHRVHNGTDSAAEFIVVSQPSTQGDRIDC